MWAGDVLDYLPDPKSIISPKLQLLSGHSDEKSLAIYHDFALTGAAVEYEAAMRTFPVR